MLRNFPSDFGIIESPVKMEYQIDSDEEVQCKRSVPLCVFKPRKAGRFVYWRMASFEPWREIMSIYTEPRSVSDLKESYFYHTMDLPGIGKIEGNWDLRPNLKKYLGGVDFRGRRVMDVGCASGILSFYMEQQGAEVVSFDLDKNGDWDMVPFAKWDQFEHIAADRKLIINKLNNAYWLAHRLLDSKARVVYGSVYAIPP